MSGPQARRVSGWARSLILTPAGRSSPLGQPRATDTDTEAARRARGAGAGGRPAVVPGSGYALRSLLPGETTPPPEPVPGVT